MERQSALVLSIIFFIIFGIICYYGAYVTAWSSVAFAVFVSLILLGMFYPVSQLTTDPADFTLYVYAACVIIGVLLLAIYIAQRALSDVRSEVPH